MSEPLALNPDRRNYRSIVLAGLGTVGQGVLAIGKEYLQRFDEVLLLDNDPNRMKKVAESFDYPVRTVDIENSRTFCGILSTLRRPALLVNACTNIDTVELRKSIQHLPVGYIDICESRIPDGEQHRLSVSMPYTNQDCHGRFPHLICQGCNPGMVEYIARMLMHRMEPKQSDYSITIYENDQIVSSLSEESVLVSWSPEDLIDEVMNYQSLSFLEGRFRESYVPSKRAVMTYWDGCSYPAFQVAHEDIWNLGCLDQVSQARFFYGFCDNVMGIFQTDVQTARQKLRLPAKKESIEGLERIVVSVEHVPAGTYEGLLWELDHGRTLQEYGINAVQFQTGASVLLSVLLMQHTQVGCLAGTYNGSTLPLAGDDWNVMGSLMKQMGIHWQPVPKSYVSCPDGDSVGRFLKTIEQST